MSWWRKLVGLNEVETKDIEPWRGGAASSENGNNFVTNQVTVADYADWRASAGGGALGHSATWACVNLLAGTISSLPLMVYQTDTQGVRSVARQHPLYYVLHDSPNFDQTALDFWEYMAAAVELQGNAYATIEKRADGSVYSLTPVRPDLVRAERVGGRLRYTWNGKDGAIIRAGTDVLHIRGPLGDALSGLSTLSACRGAFDTAQSADSAAGTVFRNGARPSGVLSTDKSLNGDQRRELEALLQEKFVGSINAGRPMLLDNALKWDQLTIDPVDAQMLESRRFSVEEICRVFGVPPHMVGHTENSTSWGTGLEQQTLGFVKFSLRRRLKRIEQAVEKQLLTPADRIAGITIEFNLEGLLRGDSAGRASFYQSGLNNGWMTINEVRRLENMPPVPGGDVPRMQSQNVAITQSGEEAVV
ncbi:phage portal protein [Sphingomonas sp. 1P06PA]|uniref:phage portal protein n=1 Tax=Sphingomonas sp. 1P06PA TaxID=554121 RepID=UPI0039A45F79